MKFDYKDLLHGTKCCESCNIWILLTDEKDKVGKMYCPIQEQIVRESGDCDAYEGFFKGG